MRSLKCFSWSRECSSILCMFTVLFSAFKSISASCIVYNIPENSGETRVKSDIGGHGQIYISPGNTFEYIAFQPVFGSLFNIEPYPNVLTITKQNFLETNKLSENQKDYEIYYSVHKDSHILRRSAYIIVAYIGQTRFGSNIKYSRLKGTMRSLVLNVMGGAKISFNCKPVVGATNRPLPSRNNRYNKTTIDTRNPKSYLDNDDETLLPRYLPPSQQNEADPQNPEGILITENLESREYSFSSIFNLTNSTRGQDNFTNFFNLRSKSQTEALNVSANNLEGSNFFSANIQYIFFGFSLLFLISTTIIIFVCLQRSKIMGGKNEVCTDMLKKTNQLPNANSNEYKKQNLSLALEAHQTEATSNYYSHEYKIENEYEMPPPDLCLSSQNVKYENDYCNIMTDNNDYVDMDSMRFKK